MRFSKKSVEIIVGEKWVEWFNEENGTSFTVADSSGEAPDLVYAEGARRLRIEITVAYYDDADAKLRWTNACGVPDAPQKWSGINFDVNLVKNINERVAQKCLNRYGQGCVLVLYLNPRGTTLDEFSDLVCGVSLPNVVPFDGVYITGHFPIIETHKEEYYVWPLKPLIAKGDGKV